MIEIYTCLGTFIALLAFIWTLHRSQKKDINEIKKNIIEINKNIKELRTSVIRLEGAFYGREHCMLKNEKEDKKTG